MCLQCSAIDNHLQLIRNEYSHVIEVGDDGWEYSSMVCGKHTGEVMVCENTPHCTKVAHAACVFGKRAPPKRFVCSAHTAPPTGRSITKSQVTYRSSVQSFDLTWSVVDRHVQRLHEQHSEIVRRRTPVPPPPPRSQLHYCTCAAHVLRSHKLLHEFEILQYLEKKKQTEVRRNQPVVDCSDFSACTAWAS